MARVFVIKVQILLSITRVAVQGLLDLKVKSQGAIRLKLAAVGSRYLLAQSCLDGTIARKNRDEFFNFIVRVSISFKYHIIFIISLMIRNFFSSKVIHCFT